MPSCEASFGSGDACPASAQVVGMPLVMRIAMGWAKDVVSWALLFSRWRWQQTHSPRDADW